MLTLVLEIKFLKVLSDSDSEKKKDRQLSAVHVQEHSSLPLHLEFMMVQLFQIATAARCVTMATAEATERETMQELNGNRNIGVIIWCETLNNM